MTCVGNDPELNLDGVQYPFTSEYTTHAMVVVSYPISLGAKTPWCKAGLAQRYINQKYNMEVQDQEFVNEPWLHESKLSDAEC